MVIFTHIPRTGGTTLQRIAQRQYRKHEIGRLYGPAIADPARALQAHNPELLQQLRFVSGHNAYGVHLQFPEDVQSEIEDWQYMTILRHPIDRCVSVYDYVKRSPSHHLNRAAKAMDLKSFATCGITTELDNGMVRQISGRCGELPQEPWPSTEVPIGAMERWMLGAATNHLESEYAVVGILEDFELTLRLCRERLGWRDTRYAARVNVSPRQRSRDDLDAETIKTLVQLNYYDQALYEHGCWLMREACSA